MDKIAVLDYGSSNLRSVIKALEFVSEDKHEIFLSDNAEQIIAADKVVFPGQGAIGQCMKSLNSTGLVEALLECIRNKPFLGICLGLQSLVQKSDEDGGIQCLGVIPGKVLRFPNDATDTSGNKFKIPQMGWNTVSPLSSHPLWKGIGSDERFYFVHSYYVKPELEKDTAAMTNYIFDYTSVIARENLFAVQFHPEKSQHAGLQLLSNFLDWQGNPD